MKFGPGLVIQGAKERLAPIMMTALATGLALVPLVVAGSIPGSRDRTPDGDRDPRRPGDSDVGPACSCCHRCIWHSAREASAKAELESVERRLLPTTSCAVRRGAAPGRAEQTCTCLSVSVLVCRWEPFHRGLVRRPPGRAPTPTTRYSSPRSAGRPRADSGAQRTRPSVRDHPRGHRDGSRGSAGAGRDPGLVHGLDLVRGGPVGRRSGFRVVVIGSQQGEDVQRNGMWSAAWTPSVRFLPLRVCRTPISCW